MEAARPALAKITMLLNDIFSSILTFSILLKRKMNKISEMRVRAIIEGLVRLKNRNRYEIKRYPKIDKTDEINTLKRVKCREEYRQKERKSKDDEFL